jgi:hypothetical protein
MTLSGIEPATFRFVAQNLNHFPHISLLDFTTFLKLISLFFGGGRLISGIFYCINSVRNRTRNPYHSTKSYEIIRKLSVVPSGQNNKLNLQQVLGSLTKLSELLYLRNIVSIGTMAVSYET